MPLPPFPVDESTLQLLDDALDPQPTGTSSVSALLELLSQLGGSDTSAVAVEHEHGVELRDPQYHEHDVIRALVAEVRRLRGQHGRPVYRHVIACSVPDCGMTLHLTDSYPDGDPSEPPRWGWRRTPERTGWICQEHPGCPARTGPDACPLPRPDQHRAGDRWVCPGCKHTYYLTGPKPERWYRRWSAPYGYWRLAWWVRQLP